MAGYPNYSTVAQVIPSFFQYNRPNILRRTPSVDVRSPRKFPGPFGPQYCNILRQEGIERQVTEANSGSEGTFIIRIQNENCGAYFGDEKLRINLDSQKKPGKEANDSGFDEGLICHECELEKANHHVEIEEVVDAPEKNSAIVDATSETEVEIQQAGSPDSDNLCIDLNESSNWKAYPSGDYRIKLRKENPKDGPGEFSSPEETNKGSSSTSPEETSTALMDTVINLDLLNDTSLTSAVSSNEETSAKPSSSPSVSPPSYYAKQHWKKILLQMFIRKGRNSFNEQKNNNYACSRKINAESTGVLGRPKKGSHGLRKLSRGTVQIKKVKPNGIGKLYVDQKPQTGKSGKVRRCLRSNTQERHLTSLPKNCRKYL